MNFQDLITYTRERCGIVNNNTVTDPTLMLWLNRSLGSLDDVLATTYNDYRMTPFLAVIGGGGPNQASPNNRIPLPPDFSKLRGVDYGSPGAWITLYGFGMQERNRYNNPLSNMLVPYTTDAARRVRVMDGYIYIEPQQLASGQYQVWYTPKFQPLVNPSDPLPSYMDSEGWIEYAVCDTGIKVYTKLLLNPASFATERAYYEDRVRTGAQNRMSNGPKVMQNVRNIGDTSYPFSVWGYGGFR